MSYFFVYTARGKWHVRPVAGLQAAIRCLPEKNKDWVVYTEGMGKIFTSNLDRGMQMAAQYNVNVLLFDYPSIRTTYKSFRNYRFSFRNSRTAHRDYLPLLDSIWTLRQAGRMGHGRLTLFFHSMGNNVIREIARQKRVQVPGEGVWVDNLILNAPCVPRGGHRRWVNRIDFSRRLYVHYNPRDVALRWARLASFRQVLGEHAKRPLSDRAEYINFNTLSDRGHSNFLSLHGRVVLMPEAKEHYQTLLHGDSVQLHNNPSYRPTVYRHVGWDILPASAL